MTLQGKFIKGGAVLTVSQVAGQVCSLGRNIIIARLVSPSDFGIASIFVMTVLFLEMISNLSLDRLLVQAEDGNDEKFQQVGQFLQAIRGMAVFFVLLVLSPLLSKLFSIPHAQGAFSALAFIPLLNGFCHLDPQRMERDMLFGPNASIEITSQIFMLALAWPLGSWLGNYQAMLYLLILKSAIMVLGSHLVAARKYRWSMDRMYVRRFTSFGWPLLLNGLLLFGVFQGDRFLLGAAKKLFSSSYDMNDVGLYSAAFMLAMMPGVMLSKICSSLFLPSLAKEQSHNDFFLIKIRLFSQGVAVIAIIFNSVMLFSGDRLLPLIYGKQYSSPGNLVALLSVMWTIRIVRALPSTIAMAKRKTKLLMFTNIIRTLALAGTMLVVVNGMNLNWIAVSGVAGEALAYTTSLFLNKIYLNIPLSLSTRADTLITGCAVISALLYIIVVRSMSATSCLFSVIVVSLGLATIAICFFPDLKRNIKGAFLPYDARKNK